MSEDGQPDVRPEDALQVAQRALAKVNELEEEQEDLTDQVDELQGEVTALRLRQTERDEERTYQSLTLDEKVGMVREHAFRKARDGHGRATLDYDDVMWEVFDGEPGSDHCYKLIRLAAGLTDGRRTGSEIPGFTARDPDGTSYHLAVDTERAKANRAFSPENKTAQEEGR